MNNSQLNGREGISPTNAEVRPNEGLLPTLDDQNDRTLGDPLGTVWRRRWMILLTVILVAGLALGFSLLQTPTYEATAMLLVSQDREDDAVGNNLQGELQGLERVNKTIVQAVSTRPIAQAVAQKLDLNGSVQGSLSAKETPETQFIQVTATDPDPERAQLLANTVGDVLSERVAEVVPEGFAITVGTWDQAVVPNSPASPDPVRNVLIALALGLMIGVGLALLLELLDDKIRSPEEAEQVSGVPSFGAIPAPSMGQTGVSVWKKPDQKENPS